MSHLPRLAMVSTDIRRDLIAPLRYCTRLQVRHFYRRAPYNDLTAEDLAGDLVRYRNGAKLYQDLLAMAPDVIQGVEPFSIRLYPTLYATYAAARRLHVPLILVTLENRPLEVKHGPLKARLLRTGLRPIMGYARLIVYLNEGARRNVLTVGHFGEKLVRLMYGTWGVDLDEFSPKRDGREPSINGCPVLLFVGRIHPEKGIFDLLDAFELVRQGAPQARLVIVGDGPARAEVEERILKRKLGEAVTLTGSVKNRDLPPYYRAADIFVAPSITTPKWEEQVGMANIQAMACGVPIVSTWSGAIPEYVPDEAGILVPERAPQALAREILRLAHDPKLRVQMGAHGRSLALHRYNARENVKLAEDLIVRAVFCP